MQTMQDVSDMQSRPTRGRERMLGKSIKFSFDLHG